MIADLDGLGLAALVRSGQVTPLELVDAAIARIERLNGTLNAVITPMFEAARRQALGPQSGPFAGVPFLVKDLMVSIPGHRMSNGSRAMLDYVARHECPRARTIREAGFIVLGKTNASELGASPLTNPQAFGPTCNPWRADLNSGGSSGGSAAAVAARVVPMASASDGGGSIRLPASYCGVFGFKPGRGVNPYDSAKTWGGAVASHVITLSVRDSAAYLDWSSAGRVFHDPAAPPAGSYLAQAQTMPGRLRIGLCVDSPSFTPVHPSCVEAVEQAGGVLESLGHDVVPCPLPYDGRALLRAFLTVVMASTARDLRDMAELLNVPLAALAIEPTTRFLGEVGLGISEHSLSAAQAVWAAAAESMRQFHTTYDVLLSPVVATLPLAHDALALNMMERFQMALATKWHLGRHLFSKPLLDQAIQKGLSALPFTQLANVTGQPAMSVPLHWTADGLPVGVQFIAGHGRDGLLFSLAGQLEAAQPWCDRRPPLTSGASL